MDIKEVGGSCPAMFLHVCVTLKGYDDKVGQLFFSLSSPLLSSSLTE